MTRVARFSALGFSSTDFSIHAHDRTEGFGIAGLLGLSFPSRRNLDIRFAEGRILVERNDSE